jgi:hypothetical protein
VEVDDDVAVRHAKEVALAEEAGGIAAPRHDPGAGRSERTDAVGISPEERGAGRPCRVRRPVAEPGEEELGHAPGAASAQPPAVEHDDGR